MTADQRRRLQDLVDDYRKAALTNDQIEKAVRNLASRINPPIIDPADLDQFLRDAHLI